MSRPRALLVLVAGLVVAAAGVVQVVGAPGMTWLGVLLLVSAVPPVVVGGRELGRGGPD